MGALERHLGAAFATVDADAVAAIFQVGSRDELDAMLAACPAAQSLETEIVALHDKTGFPLSFGRSRGQLAAWEKLIASSRS